MSLTKSTFYAVIAVSLSASLLSYIAAKYVDVPPPVTNIKSYQSKTDAPTFDKAQMAIKIMPGSMTQAHLIKMDASKEPSPLQSDFAESTLDIINSDDNSGQDYFYFDKTELYFPRLAVTEDFLPLGNSKPYCLHLDWYLRSKSSLYANYKSVSGIDTNCTDFNNPKVLWPKGDPGDGLSFQAFK